MHEGLTQLLTDIVTILGVGILLEWKFGFVQIGLLYLISGAGGSIFSTLFIMTSVIVGASGALAGLRGGTLSNIAIEYWSLHLDKYNDNFANMGGLIIGILIRFVIFTRPPVNRVCCTALSIVTFVGLLIGVVLTLKGVNLVITVHGAVTLIVFLSHIGVANTKELIVKVLNLEIFCT
ncbi:RHOMBOID protein [Trifolium repens]|nr:RHOMBOID protein [Trifolium repens]